MFWYIRYISILENDRELKIVEAEYIIQMNTVSKIHPHIRCIPRDMFSPSQGSILFQNSSLNRTSREIFNILRYRGPNRISEDVTERKRTIIAMVGRSDSEDEPVTRGIPYNFAVLNSPVTGNLGKRIINPKW